MFHIVMAELPEVLWKQYSGTVEAKPSVVRGFLLRIKDPFQKSTNGNSLITTTGTTNTAYHSGGLLPVLVLLGGPALPFVCVQWMHSLIPAWPTEMQDIDAMRNVMK